MPIGGNAAKALDYDACYGDNHGVNQPSSLLLALYNGDPLSGGTVLVTGTGGYAPVALPNTSVYFPDANPSTGEKPVEPVAFVESTGAWSASFDHWALIHGGDGVTIMDAGALTGGPWTVGAAGVDVVVTVTLS